MPLIPFVFVVRRGDADTDDDEDDDHKAVLSTGAIAGIAVGAAVVIIAIIVLLFLRRRKLRGRKLDGPSDKKPKSSSAAGLDLHQPHSKPQRLEREPPRQIDRQMTEPMTPAPAYSAVQNIDSSYNAHTGNKESELDGKAREVNEMGTPNNKSDLNLPQEKLASEFAGSHSGADTAVELPTKETQRIAPSEQEKSGGQSAYGRLNSDVSELPDSSISSTMMGTNMTYATVSSMGTTR